MIFAKKNLGQNFLNNEIVIRDILSLFSFTENDLVIEIGPGRGALTKYLSKMEINTLCIEVDRDMNKHLKSLENDHLHVLYQDFLETNLSELIKDYQYNNLYIIGNLPYYITSPILEHIIESDVKPDKMAFMVQKEVANRFCASAGSSEYGFMTLYLNYYYQASKKLEVSRYNFIPIPNVDSSVIMLTKKDKTPNVDFKSYVEFLKEAFHLKRKTLKNNLASEKWTKAEMILSKYGISPLVRSEELREDILVEICNSLKDE